MNLRAEQSGIIECEVKTRIDQVISSPANLSVYSTTKIQDQTRGVVEVVEDSNVDLECRANTDKNLQDSLTISWFRDNQMVEGEELIDFHDRGHVDISITSAKHHHSGQYQCLAQTSLDEARSQPVEVVVRNKTRISLAQHIKQVVEGEALDLSCEVESATPAEVSWYKNGEIFRKGRQMTVGKISREDSGDYVCHVKTELDQVNSSAVSVEVFKAAKISSSSKKIEAALLGSDVTLSCSAVVDLRTPADQISWSWLKDEKPLAVAAAETTGSVTLLELRNVGREVGGHYACVLNTNLEEKNHSVSQLKILKPLNFTTTPQSVTIAEGGSFQFDCSVVVDDELVESTRLSWYKHDTLLSSVRETSISLNTEEASQTESGNYSCLAETALERQWRRASLQVVARTEVSLIPSSREVMEGDSLELTCSFTTPSSVLEISWWRGASLLGTGLHQTLLVESLSLAEGGEVQYRCHLTTQLDQAEAVTTIAVYRPTVLLTSQQDWRIIEGGQAVVTCSARLDPRLSQNSTTIFIKENFLIEPHSQKVDLFNIKS